MAGKVIEVNQLVKEYNGRRPVLDGISASIDEGEFVTVYGRSGSGKTTLLNILGGLDRPTSGEVAIDGQSIIGLSEDELSRMRLTKIGFVFQDFNLLLDMTVRDNIALPLRFSGKRDKGKVEGLLEKFEIKHVADETVNRISGGEAQRAAIARALMNDPKIILADEPTGNLDLENTENVIRIFQLVMKDFGTTIVLATHDRDLAGYSSSKIMLSDGKAVVETPDEK
jgi:putative ABC transport system ATP-binding protein